MNTCQKPNGVFGRLYHLRPFFAKQYNIDYWICNNFRFSLFALTFSGNSHLVARPPSVHLKSTADLWTCLPRLCLCLCQEWNPDAEDGSGDWFVWFCGREDGSAMFFRAQLLMCFGLAICAQILPQSKIAMARCMWKTAMDAWFRWIPWICPTIWNCCSKKSMPKAWTTL